MTGSSTYYPLFFRVAGKKCVVVGGGEVARRKVEALLTHGAEVHVISPDLCAGLRQLFEEKRIYVITRKYKHGDLEDAVLVFVATDNARINRGVAAEAKQKGVPVNIVDNPRDSDFIVPSSLHRGDLTIAVSTSGKSPALARKIRLGLEQYIGAEYESLVALVDEVRREIRGKKIELDGDGWEQALEISPLLEMLRNGEREKAKVFLLEKLKKGQHG